MFRPIIRKVMKVYQPDAVVLQCGADSLAGDRLGCFNLSVKGHADCLRFLRSFNVPLMVLGGGGYTIRNVARCWCYETAIAVGVEPDNKLPYNEYYEYYGPDYTLHVDPSAMENLNAEKDMEKMWQVLHVAAGAMSPQVQSRNQQLPDQCWKSITSEEDMIEFVRNSPSKLKEYYIQMQAAKRSQAPLPSQVKDDTVILYNTVADQMSIWRSSKGLTDNVAANHDCSGETCTFYQIGDAFFCEQTGQGHVGDDTCREVVLDPANELLVCTISGHYFDRLLSPDEMEPNNLKLKSALIVKQEKFNSK